MIHYSGKKQHICKYCAKTFSTKWNVYRHIKLYHQEGDPIVVPDHTEGIMLQKLVTQQGKADR